MDDIDSPPRTLGAMRLDDLFEHLALVLMVLSAALPLARATNYVMPLLAALLMLANRRMHIDPLVRPYMVVVAAGLLLSPFANVLGFQDLYLILAGCSVALVGYRRLWSWNVLFVGGLMGQFVTTLAMAGEMGLGAYIGAFQLDIMRSVSSLESNFSFVFGVLAVWAAYEKRWTGFLLALVMTVLTLKRIAVLGVLLCLMVQVLPRQLSRFILHPVTMIVVNGAGVALALMYGSGVFDTYIVQYTQQSANELGQGRQELIRFIVSEFLREPARFLAVGMGPGESYRMMKGGADWMAKQNLHADNLKILYEYGAIVFVAFFWALFAQRHFGVRLMALYVNVILLTDNTLIYPFFIYFATLAAACMAARDALVPAVAANASPEGTETDSVLSDRPRGRLQGPVPAQGPGSGRREPSVGLNRP